MVVGVTEVLNLWAQMGVFSYIIPFLLIFAVVFAILDKTRILGERRGIMAIVALAVGLLSLLNDHVPRFFEIIFPRFGIGLSVFLVLIILLGFFFYPRTDGKSPMKWIGYVIGIGVVLWALTSWEFWSSSIDQWGIGWWLTEYFWSLVILGGLIAIIIAVSRKDRTEPTSTPSGSGHQ